MDRLLPFAYGSLGSLLLLDADLTLYDLALDFGKLMEIPLGDADNDAAAREAELACWLFNRLTFNTDFEDDPDDHRDAFEAFGPIAPGEIFGWEPPFQISVEDNALGKFTVTGLIERTIPLGPLQLHRIFRDQIEAARFGGQTLNRTVGAA